MSDTGTAWTHSGAYVTSQKTKKKKPFYYVADSLMFKANDSRRGRHGALLNLEDGTNQPTCKTRGLDLFCMPSGCVHMKLGVEADLREKAHGGKKPCKRMVRLVMAGDHGGFHLCLIKHFMPNICNSQCQLTGGRAPRSGACGCRNDVFCSQFKYKLLRR